MKIKTYGITISKFSICWYDLWEQKIILEIAVGQKRLLSINEGGNRNL